MDVLFNPELQFLPAGSGSNTWGFGLGDVDAGEAFVGGDISQVGSGRFSFYEVSLLDSIELSGLQSDSFRLATLAFYLPFGHTLASGSSINFSTENVVLSDDFGDELITGVNQGATVQVPEPPMVFLYLIGIMMMFWLRPVNPFFLNNCNQSKQTKKKIGSYFKSILLFGLLGINVEAADMIATFPGDLFIANSIPGKSDIVRIVPSTGIQSSITAGEKIVLPQDMTMAVDGDLYVSDNHTGLVKVNPITGKQTFVIECPSYSCSAPYAIAITPNGELFGAGGNRVVRINKTTGEMTIISEGGLLSDPSDIAIAKNGDIFVRESQKIIRLTYDTATNTWEQHLISTGGWLISTGDIAVGEDGNLYIVDLSGKVLRIDPSNGIQTLLKQGSLLVNKRSISLAPNGDIFVAGSTYGTSDAAVIRLRLNKITQIWDTAIVSKGTFDQISHIVIAQNQVRSLSFQSQKDAYVRSDLNVRKNDNYGMQDFIMVGTSRQPEGSPDAMRALIQFDLDKVPATQLQSAKLQLSVYGFDNGTNQSLYSIEVHRILENQQSWWKTPWNEGNGFEGPESTGGVSGGGPTGSTDPDSAHGVAWSGAGDNDDVNAINNETQPDFDIRIDALATIRQDSMEKGSIVELDITTLVWDWLNDTLPNNGLMLLDNTTDGSFRGISFGAKEGFLNNLPNAVTGPRLVLRFKNGDLNDDNFIDKTDVQLISISINQPATGPFDPRDIDGDGKITILDSRRLVSLCNKPKCATK
jgi:DNA-binding beta-propeller fold protein YncE